MNAPAKDQLDRYFNLVTAGEDPEDVVALIWEDDEEEAPLPIPAPRPAPDVMVTEFPDGIVVGWDTCSIYNGGCGLMVKACTCAGGPKPLKVFSQWMSGEKDRPDYARTSAAGISTTVTTTSPAQALAKAGPRTKAATPVADSSVTCVLGDHRVAKADADKNDDDTYSCHTCQEAGTQRSRS